MLINLVIWAVLGLISGFIASKIVNKTGEGLIMDIVLGLVGALVGAVLIVHSQQVYPLAMALLIAGTVTVSTRALGAADPAWDGVDR